MPALVTPGLLNSRASLYHQLGQLTNAGLTLEAAIELQRRSPPARFLREGLDIVLRELQNGATFADALQSAGRWVPAFDIALLHAGEQSGRLPACFALLSEHYESSARLLRQLISGLLYPALLFHMAVLLAPLPQLVQNWNVAAYLGRVLAMLLPVYAILIIVSWITKSDEHPRFAAMVEALLRRVPLLGRARRNLAVARLSSALEALLSAGVPIFQAWNLAGAACGSPALRRAIRSWQPLFENGVTPAEALRNSPEFPDAFVSLYHTGEVSGSLDDTLRRLRDLHQEEGTRQMKAFTDWTPKLVYFAVAFMVAWQVIKFWTGYFDSIGKAIQF